MIPTALSTLIDQLVADGHLGAADVLALRGAVYPDGAVSRAEADGLVQLAARGCTADPAWPSLLAEALADHALHAGPHSGHVDDDTATWLGNCLGRATAAQLPILIDAASLVLERAESAPADLSPAVRGAILRWVGAGPMTEVMVAQVRRVLHAAAGAGDVAVTADEAAWLFDLDQATAATTTLPAFTELFVRAVSNYVVGHGPAPVLTQQAQLGRTAWLAQEHATGIGSFVKRAFGGGFSGWWAAVRQPGPIAELEAAYEARNEARQEAEALEASEAAWVLARIQADAATTANEQALAVALGLTVSAPVR